MKHFCFITFLFVVMLIGLAACQAASAPPTTAPTSAPPTATAVPQTAVPTTAAAQTLTTFLPKSFKQPMSLRVGPSWKVEEDYKDVLTLVSPEAELAFLTLKDAKIADPNNKFAKVDFPEDFVGWIQTHGLFPVVKTNPVTVAGSEGTEINATVTPDCGVKSNWLFFPDTGWNCRKGEFYHFILLDDVYGQRVLIMNTGGDDFSAEHFKAGVEASQKVLDTVVFSKPTTAATTTFSSKTFKLPITLSHSAEWSVAEEYSDEFLLNYTGHDAGVSFINVKNAKIGDGIAFPDDFVTWIQSPDSLFQVKESKLVLVGGYKGIQINAIAACDDKKYWIILSGTSWKCPNGETIGFIYLDNVNGERVLIQTQGSPDGKDYKLIVAESQKVLDTVVFSKPAAAATTTFSPKTFNVPTTVSYGSDWKVSYDYPGKYAIDDKDDFGLAFYNVTTAELADPKDGHLIPFPEDFLAWLKSNPDFDAVNSTPVTVAGIEGLQIDATPVWKSTTSKFKLFLSLSGDVTRNLEGQPDGENIVTDREQWRFILLNNVNGQRVLVLLINGGGHDFQDAVTQSQKVLDTVVFSKPSAAANTTFSAKTFKLPTSVSFGSQWTVNDDSDNSLYLMANPDLVDMGFVTAKSTQLAGPAAPFSAMPFPEDFAGWIKSQGLFRVTATKPVVVGGFQGVQTDVIATVACSQKSEWLFLNAGGGMDCFEGMYLRFIYLPDVYGERLLIFNTSGGTALEAADNFKAGVAESQKVLDTVVFSKPSAAQAPTNADAIAGTWSGTAKGADSTFQITTTIAQSCAIGTVCGPFDIPAIPCSGSWTLRGINDTTYQFQASNFKGKCSGGGASDSLQLLPDGTLLYTCTGSCGEEKGILKRVVAQSPNLQLVEYKIPTAASEPGGIVAGPDGALWFVETAVNKIGRISTAGVVTEYPVPTAGAIDTDQGFLAVGQDGALWFNEDLVNKIGRITTEGKVTEFVLPDEFKPTREQDSPIRAIVAGPDGALWVTSSAENAVVKLTMDGKIVAKYVLPNAGSGPVGMAVGPDGALWFVEKSANQIGRITLDGKLSEYALPDVSSGALRITEGPDKAMWFTMNNANKIGRISTDGKITTFDAAGMGPVGITAGADGALWFTGYGSTEIGRMTTDGKLTKIQVPTTASVPYHIIAGPDGNLWFTEQQGNRIGQIQLPAPTAAQNVAP